MNDESIILLRYMHVRDMIESRFFEERKEKERCVRVYDAR